ncbi:MAG: BNR-4 repeat-containing protein, partial [Candidatus Latescibacteria bacterium]|nr:BNR-4 repeat-containing protein [Candidatus Latescibacterota bacterium]
APVSQPLDIPYAIKPFQHENEQFGYLPDYPVETQVYFNEQNQPFIRTIRGIVSWRNDQWTAAEYPQPVSQVISGAGTKVSFDADGDIYVLATSKGQHVLLYSADNGETFSSHPLPESPKASFDIEQFSGHNIPQGPPPIVRFTRTQSDPNHFWRRFGDQELLLPVKTENGIEWEDPVYLTDKSLGVSSHSGIPSNVVSRDNKIHIAWGEATDPDDASIPGVPAYVATYDRDTKELSGPYLIGYGAPPNDVHNTPCITMDSKGYLHVLTGTHGSPFHYSRSLKPNDASGGWTDPEPVGENLRQTYIGLVCDPNDTLHLCFRLWRHNTEYFPVSYFASLSHMSKRPNEPWSEPNVLTVAPFSEYSIYYHRLTINRTGHLFLSYDYWSTFWFYRTDHNARRRALMTSPDGGQTWKLAETNDLIH